MLSFVRSTGYNGVVAKEHKKPNATKGPAKPGPFLRPATKGAGMKRYSYSPAHPDVVAGLNDAAILSALAERVDALTTDPRTHTAQTALIQAHAVLVAAAKSLHP